MVVFVVVITQHRIMFDREQLHTIDIVTIVINQVNTSSIPESIYSHIDYAKLFALCLYQLIYGDDRG